MMIQTNISRNKQRTIDFFYENGTDIKKICELQDILYYDLVLYIIKRYGIQKYEDLIIKERINDNKVLVVSDTHIGSTYENLEMIEVAYQFAREHNITSIIHCGDLIHSNLQDVNGKYVDQFRQLHHLIDHYPYIEGITTYIILGNHDYNTFHAPNTFLLNILKERNDFNILGHKQAYISWNGINISIHHESKHPIVLPFVPHKLSFHGHSHHLYNCNDSVLKIPALCDKFFEKSAYPGFVLGYINQEDVCLESFKINNGIESTGIALKKSLSLVKK